MNIKKNILTAFILLFISIAQGQSWDREILTENKVQAYYEVSREPKENKLDKIDTTGYRIFDNDFNLIEEHSQPSSYIYKYTYSNSGLLTSKMESPNRHNKKFNRIWKYDYDTSNNLIKEVSRWYDSKGEHPVEYTYNDQNQLIERREINHINEVFKSIAYSYYDTGELLEKEYKEKYYKSGNKTERFDKCGNLIDLKINKKQQVLPISTKIISLCPELGKEHFSVDTIVYQTKNRKYVKYIISEDEDKTEYHYDLKGNLIQLSKFDYGYDNSIGSYEEHFFNSSGQLIELKELYNSMKCVYSKEIYTTQIHKQFEYLENGLLEEITWYDPQCSIERIITYNFKYKEITKPNNR